MVGVMEKLSRFPAHGQAILRKAHAKAQRGEVSEADACSRIRENSDSSRNREVA